MQKQLSLFTADRLPYRPYSANFFPGKLLVRTLAKACGEAFLLTDAGGLNWNRAT